MSILIDEKTKVIVQGVTGREGSLRSKYMKDYGTKVVAGTSPGRRGWVAMFSGRTSYFCQVRLGFYPGVVESLGQCLGFSKTGGSV